MTPGPTPNPVKQNVASTQDFTASLSGVSASGQEVQFVDNSEVWSWRIAPTPDYPSDKITYNASSTAAAGNPPTGWGTASVAGGSVHTPYSVATLTVNISKPGYYHIPIVATVDFQYTDSSGNTQTGHASGEYVTLIEVAAGDFNLSVSPSSVNLPQGGNNSGTNNGGPSTITVSSINGMTGAVSLSISNNPNGISTQFNPNATANITTPNGSDTTHNVSVFVGKSVPVGNYALHVNGVWAPSSSLSVGYYTPLTVTVQKPSLFLVSPKIEPSVSNSGPNNRSVDGSIIVDSVAVWNSSDKTWNGAVVQSGPMFVIAHPTDYADAAHAWTYSNPQYIWDGTGGTPSATTQSYFKTAPTTGTNLPYSVVVGGEPAKGFPVTTTITGTVSENVPLEIVGATNTYTVRWHLPHEPTSGRLADQVGRTKIGDPLKGPIPPGIGAPVSYDVSADDFDIPSYIEPAVGVAKATAAIAGQEEIAGFLELVGAATKLADTHYSKAATTGSAISDPAQWNLACDEYRTFAPDSSSYTDPTTKGFSDFNGGANIQVTTNVPQSLYTPTHDNAGNVTGYVDNHRYCYLYIFKVEKFEDMWYAGDEYDTHGYTKHSPYIRYHKVFGRDPQPYYAQYQK